MAEVIKFPVKPQGLDGLEWLGADTRQQCIAALQFILDRVRDGVVHPSALFVMHDDRDTAATTWSYLNLGFDPETLTVAMCRVLDDVEERAAASD